MKALYLIIFFTAPICSFSQTDSLYEDTTSYVSDVIVPKSPEINLRYSEGDYLIKASNKMIGGYIMTIGGALISAVGGQNKGLLYFGVITSMVGMGVTISGYNQIRLAGLKMNKGG